MNNKLQEIVSQKQKEVELLKGFVKENPDSALAQRVNQTKNQLGKGLFKQALKKPGLSVIAEIKRKSPSKGHLAEIKNPLDLAGLYQKGDASALSILTDEQFFNGSLSDLKQVVTGMSQPKIPVLRKDFMIDEIQIAESVEAGADAILLIVSVLGDRTQGLLEYAKSLGLDVLVEIHNLEELNIALDAGAEIIGVNHRNLSSFTMDHERGLNLIKAMPEHIVTVAESGVSSPEQAKRYGEAGFDAVLIGEALVKSSQPEKFIQSCL